MWSNRKVRFTVVMLVLIGANVALWLSNRIFGYTVERHGTVFGLVYLTDIFAFIGFALLGLLTTWLLAFRPEIKTRDRTLARKKKPEVRHHQIRAGWQL